MKVDSDPFLEAPVNVASMEQTEVETLPSQPIEDEIPATIPAEKQVSSAEDTVMADVLPGGNHDSVLDAINEPLESDESDEEDGNVLKALVAYSKGDDSLVMPPEITPISSLPPMISAVSEPSIPCKSSARLQPNEKMKQPMVVDMDEDQPLPLVSPSQIWWDPDKVGRPRPPKPYTNPMMVFEQHQPPPQVAESVMESASIRADPTEQSAVVSAANPDIQTSNLMASTQPQMDVLENQSFPTPVAAENGLEQSAEYVADPVYPPGFGPSVMPMYPNYQYPPGYFYAAPQGIVVSAPYQMIPVMADYQQSAYYYQTPFVQPTCDPQLMGFAPVQQQEISSPTLVQQQQSQHLASVQQSPPPPQATLPSSYQPTTQPHLPPPSQVLPAPSQKPAHSPIPVRRPPIQKPQGGRQQVNRICANPSKGRFQPAAGQNRPAKWLVMHEEGKSPVTVPWCSDCRIDFCSSCAWSMVEADKDKRRQSFRPKPIKKLVGRPSPKLATTAATSSARQASSETQPTVSVKPPPPLPHDYVSLKSLKEKREEEKKERQARVAVSHTSNLPLKADTIKVSANSSIPQKAVSKAEKPAGLSSKRTVNYHYGPDGHKTVKIKVHEGALHTRMAHTFKPSSDVPVGVWQKHVQSKFLEQRRQWTPCAPYSKTQKRRYQRMKATERREQEQQEANPVEDMAFDDNSCKGPAKSQRPPENHDGDTSAQKIAFGSFSQIRM